MPPTCSNSPSRYAQSNAKETADGEAEMKRPVPFPWSENEDIPLPEGYTPTIYDVIYGRGRKSYNHVANVRFRQLIGMNLDRYLAARCKVDKTLIVVGIVSTIRNSNPVGAFLKRSPKTQRWISLSDESAREKVGHCLRDMIAAHRPEEKKALLEAKKKQSADAAVASQTNAKALEISSNPWVKSIKPRSQQPAPFVGNGSNFNVWSDLRRNQMPPAVPSSRIGRALDNSEIGMFSERDENMDEMSDQQRKILFKLEAGFQGSVEELIQAAAAS